MSYGIEIRNPNGIISIDGNFKNFQVVESFTISSPNTWKQIAAYRPMPLLFMRPFSYGVTMSFDTTYDYLAPYPDSPNQNDLYRLQPGNYVLGLPIATGTGGETYGIRVWNSSGSVVFDSGKQVVNIDVMVLKTSTPEPPNTLGWSQAVSLPGYPSGLRYFLLNPLGLMASYYSYTYQDPNGEQSTDFFTDYILGARFDNENLATYIIVERPNVTSNPVGMGLNNTSIPLVSGYITL